MEHVYTLWNDVGSTRIHFMPTVEKKGNGTVIVFAGGGYHIRAIHEDIGYCNKLNQFGLNVFYVEYRLLPFTFPYPQLDARRAVRFVRANAEKFGIAPDKVAVMGSSAGGHLSATLCTYRAPLEGEGVDEIDKIDYLPNAQILCYGAISLAGDYSAKGFGKEFLGDLYDTYAVPLSPELVADEKTPRAFLWTTEDDPVVPVKNSTVYAEKLKSLNIPVEIHVFPHGPHGMGLAENDPVVGTWPELLRKWLIKNDWLNE